MSFGCEYTVGQTLLRSIDGIEFPCVIMAVQPNASYRIKYLDDANIVSFVAIPSFVA